MSARPSRRLSTQGFTLIEVLVAFAVMATLLVVLYQGVVGLRLGANAFDDHSQRELVARAVLDEALADRDLKPGLHRGTRDGRRWTIIAKSIDLSAQLPPPAETDEPKPGDDKAAQKAKREWTTQRLTVRVDSAGRPLEIETLRLVRVAP